MKASEPKSVDSNYILYGVNTLKLGGLFLYIYKVYLNLELLNMRPAEQSDITQIFITLYLRQFALQISNLLN